jgi:ATP-dependent DNA helicase PIF1
MMIKNIDETLVNGTIGKVTAFMTEEEWAEYPRQRRDPSTAEEESESKSKKSTAKGARWPVVIFKIPGTENRFREELVKSETFKVEGVNGTVEASRAQVSAAGLLDPLGLLTPLRLEDPSGTRLGSFYPQVAGADHSEGES